MLLYRQHIYSLMILNILHKKITGRNITLIGLYIDGLSTNTAKHWTVYSPTEFSITRRQVPNVLKSNSHT